VGILAVGIVVGIVIHGFVGYCWHCC
jgi:hypothetical protein